MNSWPCGPRAQDRLAGESQANRKYQAFAAKADKEGFSQAATLFRALLRQGQCVPTTTWGL
ncbi:MAG: ferritin family protein [Halobacteriota archaeon]